MPHSPKKQSSSHTKKPAPKKPVQKPTPKKPAVPPKPTPVKQPVSKPKPVPVVSKPVVKPTPKPIVPQKPVVTEEKIQPVETRGTISWTLTPEAESSEYKQQIVDGISKAVDTYNKYASFSQSVIVNYDSSVPTAHASGTTITFGNMFGYRVSLHELGHVVGGVGTRPEWTTNQSNGVWTGANACTLIKKFDGPDAVIHCDNLHFWSSPSGRSGGLNYDSELTPGADIRHVALVQALVDDMNS